MLIAVVPSPHDPDSFIKEKGAEPFRQLIKNADAFFDFLLNYLCSTHDRQTDAGRIAIVSEMRESLAKTGNAVLVDTYAQKTAHRLGVSAESVRAEFRKTTRAKTNMEATDEQAPAAEKQAPPSEREFWLVKFLLMNDEQVDWVARHLDLRWIAHPTVRKIINARLDAHTQHTWRDIPDLLAGCDDETMRSLVTQAVAENHSIENLAKKIMGTVQMLRNDFIDRELAALTRQSGQPDVSEAALAEIEKRKSELRQLRKQSFTEMISPQM